MRKINYSQRSTISWKYIVSLGSLLLLITPIIFLMSTIHAQQGRGDDDFLPYYNKGEYKKALEIIQGEIKNEYGKRVAEKRVPSDFISFKKVEEGVNLNALFRERREKGFFIEDNSKLFNLHLYAGRCYYNLTEYDRSLNHYYQALRFKPLEFQKDDIIFYEIAQTYKKLNLNVNYLRMLETSYSLNPDKYEYSLELGNALYRTPEKKKAIYHLERYTRARSDDIGDPEIFLKIGNLNEDIGRYLETVKYYKKYLEKKPDDGYIHFALGYLAYKRTGDFPLAIESFDKSLALLPEKDILRRSKANEYKADIYLKEREFEKATNLYQETIKYQDRILADIDKRKKEILKIRDQIHKLKSSLIKEQDFNKFTEYQYQSEERGRIELENREKNYEFNKLNAGKVRWNLAESYERMGKLQRAIDYYRESISFNYNSNKARERIIKLRLKIKRGY
jgi:tetratricopeptide (TPR) repeat protein